MMIYNNGEKTFGQRLYSAVKLANDTHTQTGDGIALFACMADRIVFDNMTFVSSGKGNWNIGVELRGCTNVQFHNCTFRGFTTGIRLCAHAGYDPNGRFFDQLGNSPVGCCDVVVNNCRFIDCGTGVILKPGGSRNVEIRRNMITGYKAYGVSGEGEQGYTSRVSIADNIISGGNPVGRSYGIYVGENVYDVTVIGNSVGNTSLTGACICVSTSPSQGDTPVYDVSVIKNICKRISWAPGDTNIVRAINRDNICDFNGIEYVDKTKTKGKVIWS